MLPLGVAAVLLLAEPDFGSTAVLLAVAAVMLFLAGAKLLHLLILGSVGVGTLAMLLVSSPYRLQRLASFRDPFADPFNGGFQLTQSLIAIGRGEWTGVGFGNSIQKLLYLPETHTDFLFAVIAEELGLVGVVALMAVFGVLVWRGFLVAQTAAAREDYFSAYVAWAIAAWVGLQASINACRLEPRPEIRTPSPRPAIRRRAPRRRRPARRRGAPGPRRRHAPPRPPG